MKEEEMQIELLRIIERYFDETGVYEGGKRILKADLIHFRDWLKVTNEER